jgi:GR25 family glycosyltransferase involved in LPS biosynthesis
VNGGRHLPPLDRLAEAAAGHARHSVRRLCSSTTTSLGPDRWIGRVHVINLDREGRRWDRTSSELRRIRTPDGSALDIARRFSAVDARRLTEADAAAHADVTSTYTLADQLFVHPDPLLTGREDLAERRIQMTRQEVAVALSHVAVWRRVAEQDVERALVLEDDVFLARGFAGRLDRVARAVGSDDFDVLYLSYKQAPGHPPRDRTRRAHRVFRPAPGLWQLSGYVLTPLGARRLLDQLPVVGPVDLWINHHFGELEVLATTPQLIRQRSGQASSNLYSVLPVLAQLASISRERPLLPGGPTHRPPVVVHGGAGSGYGALAEALAMLGYRVLQDLDALPPRLGPTVASSAFDAFVNVEGLGIEAWSALNRARPELRFVVTKDVDEDAHEAELGELRAQDPACVLVLPADDPDPWQRLCDLTGAQYPPYPYPCAPDRARRAVLHSPIPRRRVRWWRPDRSPWIAPGNPLQGLAPTRQATEDSPDADTLYPASVHTAGELLDAGEFTRRDDTFPGNLAVFDPVRALRVGETLILELVDAPTPVRRYASGAVASTRQYLYGRFGAELRASGAPGTVTGVFLHRSSPRQEIDIEILGRDPTRLLTNVYYNPGCEGDRIEFGYRGTPATVELGFDASAGHHLYEIEWCPDLIRWLVDGTVVHVRSEWAPTPVPHRPMEFDVNLWAPRSTELAGRLRPRSLPATVEITGLIAPTGTPPAPAQEPGIDGAPAAADRADA